MGIISVFLAIWKVLPLLARERKKYEKQGVDYFSVSKGLRLRLWLEKVSHRLETGNLEGLPSIVKWFFARTGVDNQIGKCLQAVLKSDKLETGDEALNQPLYQTH